MQNFLTIAAATVELGAIALLFTTFAHYAWTRTAPTAPAPAAALPTPAVEPIAVVVPPIEPEPIALDVLATPVKPQPKVSTVKEVKAPTKTKRRSIRKVA